MFSNLLQFLFFSTFSILLWPFLAVFTVVNEIIRALLGFFLHFSKSKYKLLSHGTDNTLWSTQLSGRIVVVGLFSNDGAIDEANERERFRLALSRKETDGRLTYEKLKQILCVKYGYGCSRRMEERKFRIQNHVKIMYDNEDVIQEDQFTADILPKLLENMDQSKPQWEWLLFPKIQRKGTNNINSLRVFRFDHGYMDGASAGLFMAENIFDNSPKFFIDPRTSIGSPLIILLAKAWAWLNLPLILLQGIFFTALFPSEKKHLPFSTSNYASRTHTFSGPMDVNLDSVKMAAAYRNTNVLSLLLHAYGGTLNKILQKSGTNDNPNMSVSLLGALLPYPDLQPRNQFTFMTATVDLTSGEKIATFRPDWTFYFGHVCIEWLGRLPIPLMNAVISVGDVPVGLNNIPFLREKGVINGSAIDQVVSWGMLCIPLGVDVMAVSYDNSISLTVHSLRDIMNEAQLGNFLQNLVDEINGIARTALELQKRKPAPNVNVYQL